MPDTLIAPPWLAWGLTQVGVAETPGPKNTPRILEWARKVGAKALGISYTADATPWCGLFAAACVSQAGLTPPPIAVRASQWGTWGEPASPCYGAVLVFTRTGGGHVGFYVAEDESAFHVLGGNQSDRVSVARIAKSRLTACRWPPGFEKTSRKYAQGAGALSRNEA